MTLNIKKSSHVSCIPTFTFINHCRFIEAVLFFSTNHQLRITVDMRSFFFPERRAWIKISSLSNRLGARTDEGVCHIKMTQALLRVKHIIYVLPQNTKGCINLLCIHFINTLKSVFGQASLPKQRTINTYKDRQMIEL